MALTLTSDSMVLPAAHPSWRWVSSVQSCQSLFCCMAFTSRFCEVRALILSWPLLLPTAPAGRALVM